MRIITVGDHDYSKIFNILKTQDEQEDIGSTVRAIINDVKTHGDVALVTYTNEFDKNQLTAEQLRVSAEEVAEAYGNVPPALLEALQAVATQIETYQEKLKPADIQISDESGLEVGARFIPLDSVGICVAGGRSSSPTSVLMNAIPARVAGVNKIVLACPLLEQDTSPGVLAAARIAGINEIYRIGGAQGVTALAYGTQSIPKVDKIIGGGDSYVVEAKKHLTGQVGSDLISGNSESVVIADDNNKPEWIAADLLAQAERGETSRTILITTGQNFAHKVVTAVYDMMQHVERKGIVRHTIENRSLVIIAQNISEAVHIANLIAPERLELAVENHEELLGHVTNAGAIFLGSYSPSAIGNYMAGASAILPIGSASRYSSGLAVTDFLKRQCVVTCNKNALSDISTPITELAKAEGLTAHALSVLVRLKK